jgi:hypothetical protein
VSTSHDRAAPTYTNLVRGEYLPGRMTELFDVGEDVRNLMQHPGWAHVSRLVSLEAAGLDAKLDGELLATRAEYARLTGRRSGLRGFEEAAHAIVAVSDRTLAEQTRKYEGAAEPALNGGSR